MIKIRPALLQDSEDIFKWRNDPVMRHNARSSHIIKRNEHDRWYKKSLDSENVVLFIIEKKTIRVGICYFHYNDSDKTAELSININPDFRKRGIALKAMPLLLLELKSIFKNIEEVKAFVKKENVASQSLFLKSNFHQSDKNNEDDYIAYCYKY